MMRKFIFFAIACLALGGPLRAQSSSSPAGHPQSETTFLELGKPIEREMRGGEKHSYKVHAEAGEFVRVVALQKGIDVLVTLLDPSGKQLLIVDSMNGSYGPEPVSIIAEDSGDLQLDVSTSSTDAPAGHYQIQLTDLRASTPTDRSRIKAERTYTEGCLLYARKTVESAGAAAAKWQESFALWQSLDDEYGQALSLNNIGLAYSSLGEKQKALDYYNQALPLTRTVGDRADEAATLNNIGLVYSSLGEKQKALDYYHQALPLAHTLGDHAGEAKMLTNIGAVYSALGKKRKALDYYNQALPLAHAVGDPAGEATTMNNIGAVYAALGKKQQALDDYTQSLRFPGLSRIPWARAPLWCS
jgi:tetratricopeptide (TPR) repeat protein